MKMCNEFPIRTKAQTSQAAFPHPQASIRADTSDCVTTAHSSERYQQIQLRPIVARLLL